MGSSNDHRRNVLFLDDDPKLLETVGQLFGLWSKNQWHIRLANTTAKALRALEEQKIDLIVLDIQMPVVDGMQFLQLLHRKHPHVPKVVMTGFATEDYRASSLKNGAELFLEKPRSPEGFESVFATLNELVSWQAQDGFRGVLRKVGLPEVIQLECLGRKSSVLEVSTKSVSGHIFIENGSIIHAAIGELAGTAAFNALLSLDGGEFHLRTFAAPPERSIEGQWEFLLMEAARLRDEVAQGSPAQPGEETPASGPAPWSEPMPCPSVASAPTAEASDNSTPARCIEEVVVCSNQGDVLYEWQCASIEMRLKLFDFIARRAAQFGQAFALGNFDRLEVAGPQGRAVAQIHSDRKLLVRTSAQTEA